MWKDFRDFITKGNLVQLAVAFVMGVAFGTVVSSFVNDLIMPIIGKLIGNVDFANLYMNLSGTTYESAAAARQAGAAPTTKACPHCKVDIAVGATRCPHCTSQLS